MSTTLEKEKAALAKEEGKLKKVFAVIKKFLAKEFLWVLFVLILGLPLALILNYVIETYVSENTLAEIEELLGGKPLFAAAYLVSLAGIYFTRTVVAAIKTLVNKPAS